MSSTCGSCDTAIESRKSPGVSCAGFCSKHYHASCIGIPSAFLKYLKTPGLHWYCEDCNKIKDEYEIVIKNTLEVKINNVLKDVELLFTNAKEEIMKIANEKLSNVSSLSNLNVGKPLYSQVASNNSMVVIKPKNSAQSNGQTKSDIMKSLNPVDINIQVSKIKNVHSGGILIGCNKPDDAHKFRQMAEAKLSSEYNITGVRNNSMKLRLVGMIEKYSDDQLLKFIKAQNNVLCDVSECKVVKIWPTKKNNQLYQAVIQIDSESFCKVIQQGHLFVNYDVCAVYDATDIKICYKCSGFNHFQSTCKSTIFVCPKCSLDHSIKDCTSTATPRCANCVNAKIADHDHLIWDLSKCTVYQKKLEHYKLSLFSNK